MIKEAVALNLSGVTTEMPYRDFYRQRNGRIAQIIAGVLGLPYIGEDEGGRKGVYYVPPKTVSGEDIKYLGIASESDFYGLAIDKLEQVGKAILHVSPSDRVPDFYSREFASEVQGLVLPGVTAFCSEDAVDYFRKQGSRGIKLRLKQCEKSDGHGQYVINDEAELVGILNEIGGDEICDRGVVLEEEVRERKVVSVGMAVLGSEKFSFLAYQKNDIAPEDQRDRYMGGVLTVVRGEMGSLARFFRDKLMEQRAIEVCAKFYERYSFFDLVASRLSFDYLEGVDSLGNRIGGVTDITGRLGGNCPALVLAAEKMVKDPSIRMIKGEVTLNYAPDQPLQLVSGDEVFIDRPELSIVARINEEKHV